LVSDRAEGGGADRKPATHLGGLQVSDAMQVSSGGALRGLGDVKVPVWVAFVAYWIIAIPVGWLRLSAGMGVAGMWWGLRLA
jgi:MATE family multidrug resistance protein